ncbi:MAG: hypothetical protein ABF608_07070 [Sporolactobacillus sp.]
MTIPRILHYPGSKWSMTSWFQMDGKRKSFKRTQKQERSGRKSCGSTQWLRAQDFIRNRCFDDVFLFFSEHS